MATHRNYGGIIWTNHALERLVQRGLPQDWAWQAFQHPEKSKQGKSAGTFEYVRKFGEHTVTVVAKQNENGEWVILSCWIDPPFAGSIDIQKRRFEKRYNKAGFWKRMWLLFLKNVLKIW